MIMNEGGREKERGGDWDKEEEGTKRKRAGWLFMD